MSEEGGTKLPRRRPVQQMQQQQEQQPSAPQMAQQQQYQQQMQQQQYQQQMQQQQYQQQQHVQIQPHPHFNRFNISFDDKNLKNTGLVVMIFFILNSKMVWKEIVKIPFMGQVEPSIIALVVNAIIAGVIYYIVTNYLMK